MKREEIIAQAIASWIEKKINIEKDIARDSLPMLDVEYFLRALSCIQNFPAKDFSIALAGFGSDTTTLRSIANQVGLTSINDIADDFNTAAAWRNSRKNHPRIIALAYGRQPGVHTLKHFAQPQSRELARTILEWAKNNDLFTQTGAQKELLDKLATSTQLERLCSLEIIADFLAAWSLYCQDNPIDAPRRALPQLGLVSDPGLFNNLDELESRLIKNLEITRQVIEAAPNFIRQRRNQIEKYKNIAIRESLLNIIVNIEQMRLNPSPNRRLDITLDDILKIFRLPADIIEETPPEENDDDSSNDNDEDIEDSDRLDVSGIASHSANSLLDNRQEELENIVNELERGWNDAIEQDKDQVEGELASSGKVYQYEYKVDRELLDWLHTFCTEDVWGGLIESKEPSLELALKHFNSALQDPIKLIPQAITPDDDGQMLSLERIFALFDQEFQTQGQELNLAPRWSRFYKLRASMIPSLDFLVFYTITWLAGRPQLASIVEEYLQLSTEIYRIVQENYQTMSNLSDGLAKTVLEGLLSLDILQVHIKLEDNRVAHKAVLLPTHPLHLWRYQRMTSLLRGLGSQIEAIDREAILKEVRRPDQFLSVIWLGSLPNGRGAEQILPISNEIHGLATFENLRNAISSQDGAEELANTVDRFAILSPYHAQPLRLAIINPPEPGKLLAGLVKILRDRRESTLPCLRIELYCTNNHKHRMESALRLSDIRDLLEDRIASGRLILKYHVNPYELPDLFDEMKKKPHHIIAIFDEASIYIRRRSNGQPLPMSPFCVRKQIHHDRLRNLIKLEPTVDDPPFSEFIQLINEAERGQRDSSPHAWADAESLRKSIDQLLQGNQPSAHWVFLADRALPSEGGMKSVSLFKRRAGQRQVLLTAANYQRLADPLKPVFDRCNLSLSSQNLQLLLEQGINLVSTGFLDMIRAKDGKPDSNRVRGLAGMLLAARDYHNRYPDALLISVDSEIARLWLRLGRKSNERCDLLGLRKTENSFILDCIEVKTTEGNNIPNESNTITHARSQIEATLEACSQAISDNNGPDPLASPRCEMLKEVFVQACQSRNVNQDSRKRWSIWLMQFFKQEGPSIPILFSGEIIRVLLRSNDQVSEAVLAEQPFRIILRNLTESHLQNLLEEDNISSSNRQEEEINDLANETLPVSEEIIVNTMDEQDQNNSVKNRNKEESTQTVSLSSLSIYNTDIQPDSNISTNIQSHSDSWPPPINQLGMIGQYEAVSQLINQVNFSRASGRRFSDKLLVGSAGVGKSSLARAIARQLLNEEEIMFNGADLRSPSMIITKLRERAKLPNNNRSTGGLVHIQKCLIFIDEVHAIHNSVATALLSAMDDQRNTTVDGINYDFNEVIFILATTDSGKRSEAFTSRPVKMHLRSYTLHELAGIVWLHGKKELEEHELSKDVCYEIAARVRCQPRRAVRMLTQTLIPYFHSITHEANQPVEYKRIALAITPQAVSDWFESQGIDYNGLDSIAKNYLLYLKRNGATSERRLAQALGISNQSDFDEVDEYLVRLGLVSVSSAGRSLSSDGNKYIKNPLDLRDKISRQINSQS